MPKCDEGYYDLSKEPFYGFESWFTQKLRDEWEETCRRLNPRAWANRKALRAATQQSRRYYPKGV